MMFQDTMTRKLFSPAHDLFRDQVRRFVETEILPYHDDWEEQGVVSREVWEMRVLRACFVPQCQRHMAVAVQIISLVSS